MTLEGAIQWGVAMGSSVFFDIFDIVIRAAM